MDRLMAIDAPDPLDTENELAPADAADQKVQDLDDQRAWLHVALEVIAARHQEPDRSDRVGLALDLLMIAAAERARRILRSDLPQDKG
jgi:hypothetical protein